MLDTPGHFDGHPEIAEPNYRQFEVNMTLHCVVCAVGMCPGCVNVSTGINLGTALMATMTTDRRSHYRWNNQRRNLERSRSKSVRPTTRPDPTLAVHSP